MSFPKFIFRVAAAACWLAACSQPPSTCSPRKGEDELKLLQVERAASDAALAFKSGDQRFLGVYGFSVEVPGVSGDPYQYKSKTKMLEGTGDVFCTKEEERLNKNARTYAKKYNEAMLSLIPELPHRIGNQAIPPITPQTPSTPPPKPPPPSHPPP